MSTMNNMTFTMNTTPETHDTPRTASQFSSYTERQATPSQQEQETIVRQGILDIVDDGYGFLRNERYLPGPLDIYVSASQIRRFALRQGDQVAGQVRAPKDHEQYPGLLRVESVNGVDAEAARSRPRFESLTPVFPRDNCLASQGWQDHPAEEYR